MWFKCFQFYWKSLFGDHPWNAVHYVNLFLIESVKNIYIQYITNFQCYSTVTMWLSNCYFIVLQLQLYFSDLPFYLSHWLITFYLKTATFSQLTIKIMTQSQLWLSKLLFCIAQNYFISWNCDILTALTITVMILYLKINRDCQICYFMSYNIILSQNCDLQQNYDYISKLWLSIIFEW